MTSAVGEFSSGNFTADEAYRYATLSFFGGFLVIFLLDKVVHFIVDRLEARNKAAIAASQSRAVLLNNEDETDTNPGTASPRSNSLPVVRDVESGQAAKKMAATATSPAAMCNSRCPLSPTLVASNDPDTPGNDDDAGGSEDTQEESKKTTSTNENTSSREAPAPIMEMLESDPHNFALKKMGILTAIAIFIHNFPEGLVTFSATLADPGVGVAVCIAIALHNAPEGAVIALPIYYATGSKWKGFMWGCLSGLSEPIGALVGWAALSGGSHTSFGIVFGLVAGMMTYISVKELIPMSLRYDPKDTIATTCIVAGMGLMALSLLLFTL
jgi:ZIP family zinc transporter